MHSSSWRRAVLANCLAVGLVVLSLGFVGAWYQDLVWVGRVGRAPRPPHSGPDSRPGTAVSRSPPAGCTPSGLARGTDQPSATLSPFLSGPVAPPSAPAPPRQHVLRDLHQAVDVMRAEYFSPGAGTWPAAIDWTAAVAQTVMSAVLQTYVGAGEDERARALFVETVAAYFGQDYLAIRGQAFDDMLWVVLGWIEAIRSVDAATADRLAQSLSPALPPSSSSPSFPFSYMTEWVPAFAHRGRLFWDLASRGWDTVLCGGGMVWDPALIPYKNSITNELWIAASAAMYLYFPGDNDTAPFLRTAGPALAIRNPRHLEAAVSGYHWLTSEVNMTNRHGLYIDGYHVAGWDSGGTACDLADNTVFTYNQGVLLTGQRHLWTATRDLLYLEDGHRLIQSVVAATGWNLSAQEPISDGSGGRTPARWHGLGRGGVIEELCDDSATCSQDGQIFKGIFFHHLAEFCAPLLSRSEPEPESESDDEAGPGPSTVRAGHLAACRAYVPWVGHNAGAALRTRDGRGRAGMWWGVPPGARAGDRDPNDRGRGRTVETQTGLVAVLRAYYELLPLSGSGTECGA